jgi:D-cysteine desulfhydrase
MPALSRALGGKANLFVKRDDQLPGAAGGNKTRKLEFCIADALENDANTIITCGAVQSNHCRLTLAWAVKEGLDCHLVLEERVKGSYKKEASGNNFLFELMGVKSIEVVPGGTDMMAAMEKKAEDLKAEGRHPYIIPGGASNAIGALGYASCAAETMAQLNDRHLNIDHIVVPSGSAGTHAGMVVGLTAMETGIPVSGMNVSREKRVQEEIVYKLAKETAAKLGVKKEIPRDKVVEAVKLFAQTEAILLDPVYSGKTAAGLIDLVRKDYFASGANVLFLHTGGSPALFAYMDSFRK